MKFLKHVALIIGILTVHTLVAFHHHTHLETCHNLPGKEHSSSDPCSTCILIESWETESASDALAYFGIASEGPFFTTEVCSRFKFEQFLKPSRAPPF